MVAATLVALTALASGGLATSAQAVPVASVARPAGKPIPRIGAYTSNDSLLNALGRDIGKPVSYIDAFMDTQSWAAIDDPGVIGWYRWEYPGYQPVWNVPMLPMVSYANTHAADGASLSAEAKGRYNRYFVTLARELVAAGQGHSYVRLGWEMNGSWYPWSEDRCPGTWHVGEWSCYSRAWQQVVTAMRSVAGAHFSFEWVPYAGTTSSLASWPGRAYVNVVGLDVYDWDKGGKVASWTHQMTEVTGLDWLRHTAQKLNLPETISEWGLTRATAQMNGPVCYFVAEMVDWIYRHDVVNAGFWDSGGLTNPHLAWALRHNLQNR